jgi:hypothetical protein
MAENPTFVQGAVFDPNTGDISVYDPLVVDMGTQPGCPILQPTIPVGGTVALWFGTNGDTVTLVDNAGSLAAGSCINGFTDPITRQLSIFGQYAYCNGVAFFDQVKASPLVRPPPLGIAGDGLPCPTTRDFFIVDMDPSDNVCSTYVLLTNGRVCQNTSTNFIAKAAVIQNPLTNGSDERLLFAYYRAIGGCKPWTGVNLAEGPQFINQLFIGSLAHNEIQADRWQLPPIALIPLNNPMSVVLGSPSLPKTNQYRVGVGQPRALAPRDADGTNFCFFFYTIQPLRLLRNMGTMVNFPSPDPGAGNNLFTFLCQRYANSFGPNGLDCSNRLQIPAPGPITVTFDADGVAIAALIIPPNNGIGGGNPIAYTVPLLRNAAPAQAGGWSTAQIIAVAVGGFVGLLTIIGFIVAFRAHRVRNFFAGVRDGVATKMRS